MDNNFLFLCVLQVTCRTKSIVLYMCSGKYNDIYFYMKITYPNKEEILYISCFYQ